MTVKKHDKYRAMLQALDARLTDDTSALEDSASQPTGGQANGGISNAPMHLGDLGTDTFMQEIDAKVLQTEQFLVSEVRAALDRLDHGTFGKCESCGKVIAAERLEAIPYTRRCTKCESQFDSSPNAMLDTDSPITLAGRRERDDSFAGSTGSAISPEAAVGTAGGGTSIGGLAGTTLGHGSPHAAELNRATAEGDFDVERTAVEAVERT